MTSLERPRRPVVILAYHYPPSREVGGLRAAKVARALRDAGHQVTVVTARLPDETAMLREEQPGLRVVAVAPHRNPRELYLAWKHRRRASPESGMAPAAEDPGTPAAGQVPLWKRLIFSLLWLPDDTQGFIGPAVRAARAAAPGNDVLYYTTAPPFTAHLAGWWLRRRTGSRWIAEFRDPWTDNPWKPDHVRTAASDAIERWLERQCLRAADLVVCVSEGIERLMRKKLPARPERVILVRNGIDHLAPGPAELPASGPFRIVHVGSFYHGRDPRPFLQGLALLRSTRPLTADDILVDLVGQCRWFDGVSIEATARDLGVADLVRFDDWVPHARAQHLVGSADLLLLLAQNQPDQVPNKLYEYLGVRRPILAFVDEGGESARMLLEAQGHFPLFDDDPAAAASAIATALSRRHRRLATGEDLLQTWTSEQQLSRLIHAVEIMP